MIKRFQTDDGKRLLHEVMLEQSLVHGDAGLASDLIEVGELIEYEPDGVIIEEGAHDNEIFFIVAGSCRITLYGRNLALRKAGTHIGEMAAVEPSQLRSATATATEATVVLRVTEPAFSQIAGKFPTVWRLVAKELSRRLMQRNAHVSQTHEKVRVFVMSSVESLPIARAIQNALEHDPFLVTVWTDGVFRASSYPVDSLDEAVDQSDFAIAVAHADDKTEIRDETWPTTRDNVIFELGYFMGRLGKQRALLVERRGDEVKLPSDLTGLTTISYKWSGASNELPSAIAPAANKLRDIFNDLGPNNG